MAWRESGSVTAVVQTPMRSERFHLRYNSAQAIKSHLFQFYVFARWPHLSDIIQLQRSKKNVQHRFHECNCRDRELLT